VVAGRSGKGGSGAASARAPLVVNGWTLYAHPVILDQVERVIAKAEAQNDPQGPAAKTLKWLTRAMFDEIPQDPTRAEYRQGKTLGKGNSHWFRDKFAGRFRLFFRYDSKAKIIVYGWVNDERTLRTYGAKTDAYAVFRGMLDDGNPPNDWAALLAQASDPAATARLSGAGPAGKT
jgi:toxin YhaV